LGYYAWTAPGISGKQCANFFQVPQFLAVVNHLRNCAKIRLRNPFIFSSLKTTALPQTDFAAALTRLLSMLLASLILQPVCFQSFWQLTGGGGTLPAFSGKRSAFPRKCGIGERKLPPLLSGGRTCGTRSTMQRSQTPGIQPEASRL